MTPFAPIFMKAQAKQLYLERHAISSELQSHL